MAPGAGSFGAMALLDELLDCATRLEPLTDDEVRRLATLGKEAPEALHAGAAAVRDDVFGPRITYSKKVFIPLTKLCRDSCGYCTFARPPRAGPRGPLCRGSRGASPRRRSGARAGWRSRGAHRAGPWRRNYQRPAPWPCSMSSS